MTRAGGDCLAADYKSECECVLEAKYIYHVSFDDKPVNHLLYQLCNSINMPAQLIFGDIKELDPTELKAVLQNAGIGRIDTAARYMGGESERKIGRAKLPETFLVDTKVLLGTNGGGDLAPEAIERSLSNSLNVLGVEKVNVLYCHGPDNVTPVAEQAKAFDEQYRKAKFAYVSSKTLRLYLSLTTFSSVSLTSQHGCWRSGWRSQKHKDM
jgi:hypothetical protein